MTDQTAIAPTGEVIGEMPEVPETLPADKMLKMARTGEPFQPIKVTSISTTEYGDKWQYLIKAADGRTYDFTLWPNVKRDSLAQWLMAHDSLESCPPLKLVNGGTDNKPFYYVTKA